MGLRTLGKKCWEEGDVEGGAVAMGRTGAGKTAPYAAPGPDHLGACHDF